MISIIKKILIKIIYKVRNNYLVVILFNKYFYKDPAKIFKNIYIKKLWTPDFLKQNYKYYSGSGSHNAELVDDYIKCVKKFISNLDNAPDLVDLGCGDFIIGSKLRNSCKNYVAVDIFKDLIELNANNYRELNVNFLCLDITKENLPDGDIGVLRLVLQHMSNRSIKSFIKKLENKYKYLILTEHYPNIINFKPNEDKIDGSDIRLSKNSAVVLTEPPFNLKPLRQFDLCNTTTNTIVGFEGYLNTKVIQFF